MKVIIVNTHDSRGGAARAAYRLHRALQTTGVESQMFVQIKACDDYTVSGPGTVLGRAGAAVRPRLDSLPVMLYKKRRDTLFSSSWIPSLNLVRKINASDADIVHLQWINAGMFRLEDLARIKKPIVWTLHDMWAFTGGCHIDGGCGKYINICGSCPMLGSLNTNDLSTLIFKRKARTFHRLKNMTIVSVSRWLADIAKKSSLLRDKCIVNLPNPINTNDYKPLQKEIARDIVGLASGRKLVLFGAMNSTNNPNKGFSKLIEALLKIKSNEIELVIFGASKPQNELNLGFPVHYLGWLYDDLSLRIIYSAADVTVVPSLQEAFGQTASESMACGTPVVAFGTSGLLDIVEHKKNGYLAKPFDSDDLAIGIDWTLSHPDRNLLSQNARQKVLDHFEAGKIAHQYIDLYEKILEKTRE